MKILGSILLIIVVFSCRIEEDKLEQDRTSLNIVATTGIIGDCMSNIVGDSADVIPIMGPGTDPHIYKPTPGDVELLDEADVIIVNGLHLEGKMAEMLKSYGKEKPVFVVSDGLNQADILKSADAADANDPHIWFDTKTWMKGIRHVTKELGTIDTNSAAYFMKNFESYEARVREANDWAEQQLDSIDQDKKILITSHDAFSYFGRAYGVKVKGIQGISTLSEVGLKEIADMVDFIIENEIKSIFVETSTSQKTAQSIVDGCKDKNYEVKIQGPLYSDALGEPDGPGGTYIGMIKENARMIAEGLK